MTDNSFQTTLDYIPDKYSNYFDQLEKVDEGGYGTVYKVEEKTTKNTYAIKKLWLRDPEEIENTLKEVKVISKIKSEYTVELIKAWREEEFAFIQMELCPGNLNKVILAKPEAFGRGRDEKMNSLEFFISCHLLRELTECLNYLHSLSPVVMHRDLKPGNVLVTNGQNGRFLKLCDFGLSKDYQNSSNTRFVGTGKYIAWENRNSRNYNFQADIFSLAVIGLEIFGIEYREHQENINCNQLLAPYLKTNLENKFKMLIDTLGFCVEKDTEYKDRPTCAYFLKRVIESTLDKDSVLNDNDYPRNQKLLDDSNNEFFVNYSRIKLAH